MNQLIISNSPGTARLRDLRNYDPTVAFRRLSTDVKDSSAPSLISRVLKNETPLKERLFDNRATLKVLTSRISMHLAEFTRQDLFKQLDELLDPETWDDDSSLIQEASFRTFLRFAVSKADIKRPSLSVSNNGFAMATWLRDRDRLSIEFLPADKIRLVASVATETADGGEGAPMRDSLAYEGSMHRVDHILESVDAVRMYKNGA